MAQRDADSSGAVEVERRARRAIREPPRRKVLLHNDDYTTQEFVVAILQTVFHQSPTDAFRLMWQVHTQGMCVAGVYPAEIAEAKCARVRELAQAQELPLLCTTEPE